MLLGAVPAITGYQLTIPFPPACKIIWTLIANMRDNDRKCQML